MTIQALISFFIIKKEQEDIILYLGQIHHNLCNENCLQVEYVMQRSLKEYDFLNFFFIVNLIVQHMFKCCVFKKYESQGQGYGLI